jgi:L-fuculose-phosphate aldolase
MESELEIKKSICEIGSRIYRNGFVAANDGNISVKTGNNEFYCTPTGVSKGYLTPGMILKVNGEGHLLEPNEKYRPSSELKMHLRVYRERSDVRAVVHAHPPYATAHAVAGIPLDFYLMPEAVISLGEVPLTKYGTPSTAEIPDAISGALQNHDAVLLQNHGALSVGDSLIHAYYKMETLEYDAKIHFLANLLGGGKELTPEQVEKLVDVRKKMGVSGRYPEHRECSSGTTEPMPAAVVPTETLVVEITKRVLAALGSP